MNKVTPPISPIRGSDRPGEGVEPGIQQAGAPGFEALVFEASRRIGDIYRADLLPQDGGRVPAWCRSQPCDAHDAIIGYLLIGTATPPANRVEKRRAARSAAPAFLHALLISQHRRADGDRSARHHHRRQQADRGAHRLHAGRLIGRRSGPFTVGARGPASTGCWPKESAQAHPLARDGQAAVSTAPPRSDRHRSAGVFASARADRAEGLRAER